MSEHPLQKLISVVDFKIEEHRAAIARADMAEENLKLQLKKATTNLKEKRVESAILANELIVAKDKMLFHKGAISALEDIKGILQNAISKT